MVIKKKDNIQCLHYHVYGHDLSREGGYLDEGSSPLSNLWPWSLKRRMVSEERGSIIKIMAMVPEREA